MAAIEQDFDGILAFLEDVFGIYKRYFRIHKIERGCIKVTLQFPADMQELIQGCIDQKCDALKQHDISMQITKPQEIRGEENPSVDDKKDSSEHNQDEATETDRNSLSCKSSKSPTCKPETNHNSSPVPPLNLAFDLDDQHVLCIPYFGEEEKSEFQEIINSSDELSNASDEEMTGSTNSDSSYHTDFEEEMAPQLKRIRSN